MDGNGFQVGVGRRILRACGAAVLWILLGGASVVFLAVSPAVASWLGGFSTLVFAVTVGMVFLAGAVCSAWLSLANWTPVPAPTRGRR